MRIITTLIVMLFLGFSASLAYAQRPEPAPTKVLLADSTQVLAYPLNVMAVIDSKCLGCHNPKARNEKGRNALQWATLQTQEGDTLVSKLSKIAEILDEGKMPPSRMVERFPNMKLTEEESNTLKAWVKETLNGFKED